MKSQFTHIVLVTAVSVLAGGLMLSGQDQRSVANIPFAFEASHVNLPAGEYTVAQMNTSGVFRLSDPTGRGVFVVMAPQSAGKPSTPSLTFVCYGSQRILSQIKTESGNGYAVSKSSIEKDLNRRLGFASLVSVALTHR
jgi:hypothetical protein